MGKGCVNLAMFTYVKKYRYKIDMDIGIDTISLLNPLWLFRVFI